MDHNALVEFVRQNYERYLAYAMELLGRLGIPVGLVEKPDELLVVVNREARLCFCSFLEPDEDVPPGLGGVRPSAASYVPRAAQVDGVNVEDGDVRDGVYFLTERLDGEAREATMEVEHLASILLMHELVHAVMCTGFAGAAPNTVAYAWVRGEEWRPIHEAMALKVCSMLAEEFAAGDARRAYIKLVRSRVSDAGEGRF